jgi:hypothetical protein
MITLAVPKHLFMKLKYAEIIISLILSIGVTSILYYSLKEAAQYKEANTPEKDYLEDRSEIYYPIINQNK